jgi:hypothetical protein
MQGTYKSIRPPPIAPVRVLANDLIALIPEIIMDITAGVLVAAILVFLSVFTCVFLFIYPLILSLMSPRPARELDSLSTDDTVINYPKRRSIPPITGHHTSAAY